jgi:hypothetical protein
VQSGAHDPTPTSATALACGAAFRVERRGVVAGGERRLIDLGLEPPFLGAHAVEALARVATSCDSVKVGSSVASVSAVKRSKDPRLTKPLGMMSARMNNIPTEFDLAGQLTPFRERS